MHKGEKEKRMIFIGLGIALVGVVWFALSVAGVFTGAAMMFGYFLGVGIALGGLIVSGVYFNRYQRIKKLLQGKDVLVQWDNGESQTIIATTCAYMDGDLYLWGTPGTRLEDVQIEQRAERSYLQITLGEATSTRDITGSRLWRTRKLSILIPEGEDLTAKTVLEQLKSRL
jgi:hypothetical protein